MPTTVFTQAHIDAFKLGMVNRQGATTITFFDQSVTFGSYEEQLAFLAMMQREVNSASGSSRGYRLAATRKGV